MGWITRKSTPESEFAPTGIETVIDNITAALNETVQEESVRLAFIPKTSEAFFKNASLGASRAFVELDIDGEILEPDGATVDDIVQNQVDIMRQTIDDGVLNLGVAPNSTEAREIVDEVAAAGGTVVTFDTDHEVSHRQMFIGTISDVAGRTAGTTLNNLIGDGNVGTVVVLGYLDEGWSDGYGRTAGAKAVLESAGHTVAELATDWGNFDANVTAIQEAFADADPPAVGCMGLFNISYACADAAVAAGLQGVIKIVAFDAEAETLAHMRQGVIQATHTQRVYYMGYLLPYVVYAINNLGIDATRALLGSLMVDDSRIDTGLDVIYADRVDEYEYFLEKLNAL